MKFPIKASCQCGQVTYTLHKAPKAVLACHCTECQKLATSPFSITAVVEKEAIDFSGEMAEWTRMADSGNRNHARFCTGCGNRIYHFNPDDSSTLKLKLKPVNIEDPEIFEPTMHVWVSEKLSWYQIPEGVEVVQGQP